MGRQARATPEELARACKKLQADDNLTIHTLRHELGGGGAEYLTRGLREWRQQQREEARVPMEQMVSATMRVALAEEMQRVGNEVGQMVHALYADDRAQLDFCLSELRRLEEESQHLKTALAARDADLERSQQQTKEHAAALTAQEREYKEQVNRLAMRLEDIQRQDKANAAELAVAREQRMLVEQRLQQEQRMLIKEREAASIAQAAHADKAVKLAAVEERSIQQQEAIRYMRTDLETKTQFVQTLNERLARTEHHIQVFTQAAARAETASVASRQRKRDHLIFLRKSGTAGRVEPKSSDS